MTVKTREEHITTGKQVIKFLELKKIKRGEEKGRVKTSWGSKTPEGLSRCIDRIISNGE